MKKSYFIVAAIAITGMVSCSSEDFVGEPTGQPTSEKTINFGSNFKAITRGTEYGADAADLLGNQFVVTGYKGATTATTSSDAVFDNYLVVWEENTANTTETNTKNWEYEGKGLTPYHISSITKQSVKYWDYSAAQYDFIAYSVGKGNTIVGGAPTNDGEIQVSAINPANATTGAYTLKGKIKDLAKCYIADIVTVKKDNYNLNPVQIVFRNLSTKVRIGLYENILGYTVKDVKFYTQNTGNSSATDGNAYLFTRSGDPLGTETADELGTMTVYYPTVDTNNSYNNMAHISYSSADANPKSYASLGAFSDEPIGETSNNASYANDGDYAIVLPNESGDKLVLRVDYTLVSEDGSGEEIKVSSASAEIPADFSTWQAGYAYTYLFKITKDTNGTTGTPGTDPAGLYPITFDAAVIQDIERYQETITTVATPSITTYTQGRVVTTNNEYKVNNDIFVTVEQAGSLLPLDGNSFLYTIPAGKTEAEVLAALQMRELDRVPDGVDILGRNGVELTESGLLSPTNTIVNGVDGEPIDVSGNDPTKNKAAKFKPTVANTYAFVYTSQAATATTPEYEKVTKINGTAITPGETSVKGYYCNYKYEEQANKDAVHVDYFTYNSSTDTYTAVTEGNHPYTGQSAVNLYEKSGTYYSKITTEGAQVRTGKEYSSGPVEVTKGEYKYGETIAATDGLYTKTSATEYPAFTGTIAEGTTYYKLVGGDYVAVTTGQYKIGESAEGLYTLYSEGTYKTADGNIVGGTTYYRMPVAPTIAYADFSTTLFKKVGGSYEAVTETIPGAATEYYQRSGNETDGYTYTRVYILPQQTNGYYLRVDYAADAYFACPEGEKAVAGEAYYDRYVVNNGKYAVKVIIVQ